MKNKQKSVQIKKIERKLQISGILIALGMLSNVFITNKVINNLIYFLMILGTIFFILIYSILRDLVATEALDDWLKNEEIKKLLQESEFDDYFIMNNKINRLMSNLHTGKFNLLMQCLKNNNKKLHDTNIVISVLKKHYGKK